MKDSKYSKGSAGRPGFSSGKRIQSCPQNGGAIMKKSKHKREKREETTEEFVKRINQNRKDWSKRNGTKRRTGRHHR